MRIFDWIHGKFHRNVDYCMVSHGQDVKFASHAGKKPTALTCEQRETEALLFKEGHVALVDLLDGGLLAIGTLGLDPFAFDDPEYSARQKVDSVSGDFPHPLPIADEDLSPDESPDMTPLYGSHAAASNLSRPMIAFNCAGGACEIVAARKKAERTTLADLFSADAASEAGEKRLAEESTMERGTCEKGKGHVRGLAKKLVSWKKGEDSRPTAKLRGVFTKMLRRKIHPELPQEGHVGVNVNSNRDKNGPKSENPALQKESTIISGKINE